MLFHCSCKQRQLYWSIKALRALRGLNIPCKPYLAPPPSPETCCWWQFVLRTGSHRDFIAFSPAVPLMWVWTEKACQFSREGLGHFWAQCQAWHVADLWMSQQGHWCLGISACTILKDAAVWVRGCELPVPPVSNLAEVTTSYRGKLSPLSWTGWEHLRAPPGF